MKKFKIQHSVHIRDNSVYLDLKEVFSLKNKLELSVFLKMAYQFLEINYPKFYKMDTMSKLGIIASEVLFQDKPSTETALVFSNRTGSLETDKLHLENCDRIPSPAIFVYTLPNIVLGEISIKYKLQSENAFFIENKFNATLLFNYSQILLHTEKADSVVCGWIDLENGEYDVFLALVSSEGKMIFSEENLNKTYLFKNE